MQAPRQAHTMRLYRQMLTREMINVELLTL